LLTLRGGGEEERGYRNFRGYKAKIIPSICAHRCTSTPGTQLEMPRLSAFVGQTISLPYELRQLRLEKMFVHSWLFYQGLTRILPGSGSFEM
jgi:hypothetical protein